MKHTMKMSDFNELFREDPWLEIAVGSYPSTARRLYQIDDRFWVSVDHIGRRLFFIQEKGHVDNLVTEKVAFVEIQYLHLQQNITRVCCILEDQNLKEMFSLVAKDIAHHCSAYSGQELFRRFYNRIQSWGEFLKPSRSGIGFQRLMGICSELYVLESIFLEILNPVDAITAWGGPNGNNQDFAFNGIVVEVKSTLHGEKRIVTISSEHQLDSGDDQCFLLHTVLSPSKAANSFSFKDIISRIESKIIEYPHVLSDFRIKISQQFGKASESELDISFVIKELDVFLVDKNFPRITPSSIGTKEISHVKYKINLTNISPWCGVKEIKEIITGGHSK